MKTTMLVIIVCVGAAAQLQALFAAKREEEAVYNQLELLTLWLYLFAMEML